MSEKSKESPGLPDELDLNAGDRLWRAAKSEAARQNLSRLAGAYSEGLLSKEEAEAAMDKEYARINEKPEK